ncbi:S8 family serine peptidase [Gallaecimonas sp. GXIMD4217]|uniref:S8 family serine peptidase n=1 Tax=Gallaecimonas sp. GXIMD4217 TaxID=3131927 RepID=UPI00311AFB1C
MRSLLLGSLWILLSFTVQGARPELPVHDQPPPAFAPDRLLVRFEPGTPAADMAAAHRRAGGHLLRTIPGIEVQLVQVPAGAVLERVERYRQNPNVRYAEPDYYRVMGLPDEGQDPPGGLGLDYFEQQWGLNNNGQLLADPETGATTLVGTPNADIDAPEGWDISTGSSAVKIAILDTGIDCTTLEFAAVPGDGAKCVEQMNFVGDYTATTDDVVAHGSHVAGIAAARTDNDIGVAGVGWQSRVGNLKACFEYLYDLAPPLGIYVYLGVCPVSSSAAAIIHAADHGYHVINMSYASDQVDEQGNPANSPPPQPNTETAALDYAWDRGLVLVAAAGNAATSDLVYPAAHDKVIATGATERNDDRASFSSFGDWVSLMAPGENILSTVPNELCVFYSEITGEPFDPASDVCLDWYSGTSMASPHVAGAAALVWAHRFGDQLGNVATCQDSAGTPCNQAIRDALEQGADAFGALGQNYSAWSQHGRLNLAGALGQAAPPAGPPSAPTGLGASDNGDGSAALAWVDNSDNETGFELVREAWKKVKGSLGWKADGVTSLAADTSSHVDASGNGTFRYCVRAVNDAGSSACTPWAEVTVSGGGKGGGKGGGGKGGKPAR